MVSSVMSIPTAFNHVNEQGGVLVEHEYDTKPENMHVLYYIARNQLYSDEILAVIREYACNGMDIHIKMGQTERPIRITLPTQLDSFLKIRDFGSGLDEEGIKGYVSFGESDKRGDPNQTGQLGIGCKSGFTYGDSFMVNSYLNGKLYVWNAYIDPSNKGKIAKMAECDTTEPDGIEVVIPIKASDVDKVHEKAMWFFSFWSVVPDFVNATQHDLDSLKSQREVTPVFSGEGWKFLGSGQSYAVMGNIAYPIKANVFTDIELRSETKELLDGGIIIQFKMDEVDFAASREQLKYTPKTKKAVSARLTDITNDLLAQCSASFTGCKTLWEAKLLYKKVFDFSGKLYRLRNLFRASLTFNGFKINTEAFPVGITNGNDTDVVCWQYSKQYNGKVRRQQVYNIQAAENNLVVVNDTGIMNGIMNRVVPLIEGKQMSHVYILSFVSDIVRDAYYKEVGLDCPFVSLASLPKEPLSKYYPNDSTNGGTRNSKHFSKEFSYNTEHQGSRYRSTRSEFWEVADVDLANDEGVYVVIEKFNYFEADGGWEHPSGLKNFLHMVKTAGIDIPDTIYGFKQASAAQARNNPKMQTLWDWFKSAVKEYMDTHPDVAQKLANYKYMHNEVESMQSDLPKLMQMVSRWDGIDAAHVLKLFNDKLKVLRQYNEDQMRQLHQVLHTVKYDFKVTPTYDLQGEYDALYARYPLLFKLAARIGTYQIQDDGWKKGMNEYVTLVDTVTP